VIGALQGSPPRYDLSLDDKDELTVIDLKTNTIVPSQKIKSRKKDITKWRVKTEDEKYRYFTENEIDMCLLRKKIATRTKEELNVRNNVEATVFQLGYHYSNSKSRYRGLSKHKIWANLRCLWVNFARILNFIRKNALNNAKTEANNLFLCQFLTNFIEIVVKILTNRNFRYNYQKNEI
jgi:Asp-tRNA(Asn)/Glu-tRNA(Gln) amidotransferase B subunit